MKNKKIYSLCEAVADITHIASIKEYKTADSREMISQFIKWAEEFEYLHRHVEWGVNAPYDYIESIYLFTTFKINQWSSL